MNEKKCLDCKYHAIEEFALDNPQSICIKKNYIIENWFKICEQFEPVDNKELLGGSE